MGYCSIIGQLQGLGCKSGGFYTFKVAWPKGMKGNPEPKHNVFRQTSDPLTVGPTEGFAAIDVQCPKYEFHGLTYGMSKGNKQSLLCNNCDGGNWWHALGSTAGPCGAQFPCGCDCCDQVHCAPIVLLPNTRPYMYELTDPRMPWHRQNSTSTVIPIGARRCWPCFSAVAPFT